MSFSTILVEREGRLATIALNRPPLNLLTPDLILELRQALDEIEKEGQAGAIIITGSGEHSLSSGVDVKEMKDLTMPGAKKFISNLHETITKVRRLSLPVIAAVNGYCLGGGLELVMACDLRLASEKAQFGLPEIRLGIPSVIEAALMVGLIGLGPAQELLYTGDLIAAPEAQRLGLVNTVVPQAELPAAARTVAEKLLALSPTAVRAQKEVIYRWLPTDLESAMNHSIDTFALCFATDEPAEAMSAFLEKRPPRFAKNKE